MMPTARRISTTALLLAIAILASCRPRSGPVAAGDSSSSSAERFCPGGPRNVEAVLTPLRALHDARASELERLIVGSSKRVVGANGGDRLIVEELSRYPSCAPSSDAVLKDRIGRALEVFFKKKDAQPHRGSLGMVSMSVGCEEGGKLLVSLGLGLGIGWGVRSTYLVDEQRAKLVVDGTALAHADLDGDGQRDVIWHAPDRHIAVRFAGSNRALVTSLEVPECEDTDCHFAGAPSLERTFGLVLAYRAYTGSSEIKERMRWNGKQFVAVERLTDDFEARYDVARERERAVLEDSMFGPYASFRHELEDHCVTRIDAACTALFETGTAALVKGGIAATDARAAVRAYVGWQRCSPE